MPSVAVNHQTSPSVSKDSPPVPSSGKTRCALEGCSNRVNKPTEFKYCSGICTQLDKLIDNTQQLCRELDEAEAAELWATAIEAVDAVTAVNEKRKRLWQRINRKYRDDLPPRGYTPTPAPRPVGYAGEKSDET